MQIYIKFAIRQKKITKFMNELKERKKKSSSYVTHLTFLLSVSIKSKVLLVGISIIYYNHYRK